MAQTTEFFPKIKSVYHRLFPVTSGANKIVRAGAESVVSCLAAMKHFHFPQKYNWEWKLEMLTGRYEESTVKVFKEIIKPGMTVADVGAHIGYFTLLFSKLVGPTGKVYSFEPDQDNFPILKKNTAQYKNIHIVNKAASDRTGKTVLYKMPGSTGCHSISQRRSGDIEVPIDVITIDDFLNQNKIEKVDVMKVDTEGAEPLVFKGMAGLLSKTEHITIMAEFNPDALKNSGSDPGLFLKEKVEAGFSLFQITDNGQIAVDVNGLGHDSFYKGKSEYANMLLIK